MDTKSRIIEFIISKGFNQSQAEIIYNRYFEEKIIKIDNGGGWQFVHGIFAEYDIMQNALQ